MGSYYNGHFNVWPQDGLYQYLTKEQREIVDHPSRSVRPAPLLVPPSSHPLQDGLYQFLNEEQRAARVKASYHTQENADHPNRCAMAPPTAPVPILALFPSPLR